ncbi:MAG: 7-carboxy-7-deazaguanine synthase QueE [Bacteroidota bacterium]
MKEGVMLPIMEQFYTIQGEGFHTGKAAYFIRIGGCDVGCHWCDVKESWNPDIHPLVNISDVATEVLKYPATTIVITGGEPLQYNLNLLTKKLKERELQVHLETSGAFDLSGDFDWVCLSPKKNMHPKDELFLIANELKVIIYNRHDFIWAEENSKRVNDNCKLFLQPEWSRRDEVTPLIIDYVKKNPKWNISLQTHKFLNIP